MSYMEDDISKYVEEHIIEGETTTPTEYHDGMESLLHKIDQASERTGKELMVNIDKNRPDVKMPLRVLYQQKHLEFGKSPIWFLQSISSLSISEFNDFIKKYGGELTIAEQIACDLIAAVLRKDAVAVERYWRIQEKLLNNRSIQQQVNVAIVKPNAIMSDLLNEIQKNLAIDGG